jgi:hypothetical protein
MMREPARKSYAKTASQEVRSCRSPGGKCLLPGTRAGVEADESRPFKVGEAMEQRSIGGVLRRLSVSEGSSLCLLARH